MQQGTWDSDPSTGGGGFSDGFSGGMPEANTTSLGPVKIQNNSSAGHMVTLIVLGAVVVLALMVVGLRASGEVIIT